MRLSNGALLVLFGCGPVFAAPPAGSEVIFRDFFEIGDSCAWSAAVGGSDVCPCGNLTLLRDSFDTAGPTPYFDSWHDAGTSIARSGGQLVIDVEAFVKGFAGYVSVYSYDLHGGWIDTSVAQVGGALTILEVRNHLDEAAQIYKEGDEILAATTGSGVLASRTWNPLEKYWRISENNGDLVWAVSIDRLSWAELHRMPLPFDVEHVRGVLSAGGSSMSSSQARFDDLNADPPRGGFCPADTLQDDFAAPPLLPPWRAYWGEGSSVAEAGGDLVFDYTGVPLGPSASRGRGTGILWCTVWSLHLYDFSLGEGLAVDSTGFPAVSNFVSDLRVSPPTLSGETYIHTALEGSTLTYRLWVNFSIADQFSLMFDPITHRYWRMRGEGATAIFETSDGTGFVERWRVLVPFELRSVDLAFSGYYDQAVTPLTATLPGVNAD